MMRFVFAVLACLIAAPASAQLSGGMMFPGPGTAHSTVSYTGPGDIASGASGWWGLRAYSAAYAASLGPAIDIEDQSFANLLTVNVKADGTLDVASINTWVTAHSVTAIKVVKLYDQTGNGNTLSIDNGRSGSFPDLTLSKLGSLPAMRFGIGGLPTSIAQSAGSSFPIAQTFYLSTVYQQRVAQLSGVMVTTNGPQGIVTSGSANESGMFAGTLVGISGVADAAFHAMQAVFNGASSSAYVDGTLTSPLSVGTSGYPAAGGVALGSDNTTFRWLDGWICEAGAWASDQSAHNAALNSNQRTYWGF